MADADGASGKSSKKNAKRQAARAKKRLLQDVAPSSGASAHMGASSSGATAVTRPSGVGRNRLTVLREEMAACKARGDTRAAQEIREQIWLLNDQAAGQLGEGFERAAAKVAAVEAAAPQSTSAQLSGPEKQLRSLRKKLQQIEKIRAAQAEGKKVEEGQLQKLKSEQSILDEIKELEELLSGVALV